MSTLFEVGIIYYTHPVVIIISVSPRFLEYIEFAIGMHIQGHWGDIDQGETLLNDYGIRSQTSVRSVYDLVEEFEPHGEAVVIVTDLQLEITIVSMSE